MVELSYNMINEVCSFGCTLISLADNKKLEYDYVTGAYGNRRQEIRKSSWHVYFDVNNWSTIYFQQCQRCLYNDGEDHMKLYHRFFYIEQINPCSV